MYKSIPLIFKYTGKSIKSNNKLIKKEDKFIKDKLEHILTPETKEYLRLQKLIKQEINLK